MIHVDKDQLSQVEYLIEQSMQGNHVLFDNETLRKVLSPATLLNEEDAYSVEPLIERLISEPSLARKRAFLEGLDRPTFEKVVRTYFNIVENSLYENAEVRH